MTLGFGRLLYATPREDFASLISAWGLLALGYLLLLWRLGLDLRPGRTIARSARADRQAARWSLLAGLGWRGLATGAIPPWSDDYFRFIWDGRLLSHGVNPFAQLPREIMADPARAAELGLTAELFAGLNSPEYYTIYPPILQGIFWLAAILSPHSIAGAVWVMKLFVLAAEGGSLWLLRELLRHWYLPQRWVALYALHPLAVMELCGNLHFEALMITALLGAIWLLHRLGKSHWWASALSLAMGVIVKLLPLMLLPLLLRRLGFWRTVGYAAGVLAVAATTFTLILDLATVQNLAASIELYFHQFEFNASVYYLVRWVGYQIYGRNLIDEVGTWLALGSMVLMLLFAFTEREPQLRTLPAAMLWIFAIYSLFSPVVHPWYATTLLALSVLTRWRWALVWGLLLPLSYFTYRTPAYLEDLHLTTIIYLGALAWWIWEIRIGPNGMRAW
jgi:alpha-1,6-mannosyltransferase